MFEKSMKKIAVAAMLGVSMVSPAIGSVANASPIQDIQDEIGTDKLAHFGVGYFVTDVLERTTPMTPIERGLAVTGLAAIKEATDNKWDTKDFLATVLGSAANLTVHGKF
jgi:hypothetical protein